MKSSSLIIIFILGFVNLFFAQSGPAGVGNNTTNFLWLKVDDISGLNNGDKISTWPDASGNSNDLSQSDNALKPYYRTSAQNGYPSVSFEDINSRLIKTTFTDFPSNNITVFIINKNADSDDGIFSYNVGNQDNEFLLYNSSNLAIHIHGNSNNTNESINNNAFHILDVSRESAGGNTEFWVDGNQEYTSVLQAGTSLTSGGCLALAAEQDQVNGGYVEAQSHQGEFLEIIAFNIELNTAQRIIVANYLAAKYGISISNDKYVYDAINKYDLAGIGRYDASNTHTAAQSAGILEISNPSSMTSNGDYLLFAHDNGNISSWTTSDCPSNVQRIQREWRFDESGNVGDITITVDNSDLPVLSGAYTKYGIMVDADGNFSSGATIYELKASGSDFTADNIDISDGDYITIVAIEPIIQFSTINGSALESSNAIADIELNYIPATNTSVEYSTADITATSGDDYTAVSNNTATILEGDISTSISVSVIDDSFPESDETFKIILSNPASGISLSANDEFIHTIIDNDNSRKVSFDAASSSASESTTNVSIGLSLSVADPSSLTYVDYNISGGTATSADYSFTAGTIMFSQNQTTANISFTVINDNIDEFNETIIISLSNPQNCNLQSPINHTYTIIDDDVAPTISFSTATSSATESNSTQNIAIELSSQSGKDVSVNISSSGTATNNVDYSLSSSTITIYSGNTTSNYALSIFNDNTIESDETVVLSISSPSNATLGSITSHTHTIINDDNVGYVGPGGVGKSDYIKLWLRAEDIPGSSDGDRISTWSDQSGNTNNMTQSNNSFRPAYYSDVVNGWAVARFNQTNNRLIRTNFNDFPTKEITTIFVNKSTGQSGDGLLSYASSSALDNDYLLFNSSNLTQYVSNSNVASSVNISDNNFNIVSTTWDTYNDQFIVNKNGAGSVIRTLSASQIVSGGCLALGAEQDIIDGNYEPNQTFNGDFAELIIFNFKINSSQRKIIENYLSSKYDISISNDMYSYDKDNASNPFYYYNVSGIGRDNTTNFHSISQGRSMVRINNASSLGNGDYLFWGDDNVDINGDDFSFSIPWTGTPGGVGNYMKRVWRVDETGNVGTVSVTVNVSGWTYDNIGNIVLMIDSDDGDFENATKQAFSSINGTEITFDNVDFSSGDFFSFGEENGENNSLPVELTHFSAELKNEVVELKWITASETNNDYFLIEKSSNANDWNEIAKINGNGTVITPSFYNFIDENLFEFYNYYRLKQIDFDGKFNYSDIKVIYNAQEKSFITIYPNPLDGENLHIQTDIILKTIEVYSYDGSLLKQVEINKTGEIKLSLELKSGSYILKLISENEVIIEKLVVE